MTADRRQRGQPKPLSPASADFHELVETLLGQPKPLPPPNADFYELVETLQGRKKMERALASLSVGPTRSSEGCRSSQPISI